MILTRPKLAFLSIAAISALLVYLLLMLLGAHIAAADTGAPPPPELQLGWLEYVGLGLAAAGGLLKVLDVAIAGLKWLAPRTKTTLDDKARDDLQIVRDDIAALASLVGGIAPNAKQTTAAGVISIPTKTGGAS